MFLTLKTKSRNGGNNHLLNLLGSNVGRTWNSGLWKMYAQKWTKQQYEKQKQIDSEGVHDNP